VQRRNGKAQRPTTPAFNVPTLYAVEIFGGMEAEGMEKGQETN